MLTVIDANGRIKGTRSPASPYPTPFEISGATTGELILTDNSEGADLKKWAILNAAQNLYLYTLDDNTSGLVAAVILSRAGDVTTARDVTVTRNLGVTGGQISFPATQVPSSGANTLDDYEEGTWTPADNSGASLSFTVNAANYVKIGQVVQLAFDIQYPVTADGSGASIKNIPFAAGSAAGGVYLTYTTYGAGIDFTIGGTTSTMEPYSLAGVQLTNVQLSNIRLIATGTYRAGA